MGGHEDCNIKTHFCVGPMVIRNMDYFNKPTSHQRKRKSQIKKVNYKSKLQEAWENSLSLTLNLMLFRVWSLGPKIYLTGAKFMCRLSYVGWYKNGIKTPSSLSETRHQ
jgi:hypothetical protein